MNKQVRYTMVPQHVIGSMIWKAHLEREMLSWQV